MRNKPHLDGAEHLEDGLYQQTGAQHFSSKSEVSNDPIRLPQL
jgi:hypothetical protein